MVNLARRVALGVVLTAGLIPAGRAVEITRPSGSAAASSGGTAAAVANATPGVTTMPSAQDQLSRTNQALQAVQAMQTAARNLALSATGSLGSGLPIVPANSYLQPNGIVPASATFSTLWTGAKAPMVAATVGTPAGTTVTIAQTQQQALLTWQTFNIGQSTTVIFDQSAGGTNAGEWIAFNYVRDPTGNPTQILGTMKTVGLPDAQGHAQVGGQIYLLNANGIIFGGSSQVNTHGLVASSLPIDYNLIQSGLLNNPDTQFLFSAVAEPAGSKGPTPAFDPTQASTDGLTPAQTAFARDGSGTVGSFGDVVVQPGATLTAPTNADFIGGRIALVGPNVVNGGTISTADGQTILAAGLQVGLVAHNSADPTLRGLDAFVGEIADTTLPNQPAAGTVTNAGITTAGLGGGGFNTTANNPLSLQLLGLIEAPRGSVYLTGAAVNQLGAIDSTTSVSYNGRVDLVAGYNAVPNPKYNPALAATSDFTLALPFYYQSNVGNTPAGDPVTNSGPVVLGADSFIRIMPEVASTAQINGDLALPSQVNLQAASVLFSSNASILAPGASTPLLAPALASDGGALGAGVAVRAGAWFNPGSTTYQFVQSADAQQVYLSAGAAIDVSGLSGVAASVTDNVIPVELRGSELANYPLQRNGVLRGQTIMVDLTQHGPWDPTLNGGLGGYSWVGTPLADTSGWVALTTHSVGELSINGGSVAIQAGGAVVVQPGAAINVSGGSINYAGGYVNTTKLLANGHVYDIASASPNQVYDGIYTGQQSVTDSKWGVTSTYNDPLAQTGTYENGYVQGGNGGSVAISAAVVALDGQFQGHVVSGPNQRTLSPGYSPAAPPNPAAVPAAAGVPGWLINDLSLPTSAQFSLAIGRQALNTAGGVTSYVSYSPTPANIVIGTGKTPLPADAFQADGNYQFPILRDYSVILSPDLFSATGAGFGIVHLANADDDFGLATTYGNITVGANTTLSLPAGGSLSLIAGNVEVQSGAAITVPDGWVNLAAYSVSPSVAANLSAIRSTGLVVPDADLPVYNPTRGNVSLDAGTTVSTAGLTVDLKTTANPLALTSGGSVQLAGNVVDLAAGSTIDVSGGATVKTNGQFAYGNAGGIALVAGQSLGSGFGAVLGGGLDLGGQLLGYAGVGSKGGSLKLQAPSVVLQNPVGTATVPAAVAVTNPLTQQLTVAPGFFNQGGFASYTLTGLGYLANAKLQFSAAAPAVTVAAQTVIDPTVWSWAAQPEGALYLAPVGTRNAAQLNLKTGPLAQNVNGIYLDNGTALSLAASAVLTTDPLGGIALSGGSLDVLGQIVARGGTIALSQAGDPSYLYLPNIHLGPTALLDATGTTTYVSDNNGYHAADVANGGTIAVQGNIVAEAGATLNVSGAAGTIEVTPSAPAPASTTGASAQLTTVTKTSNGGQITLAADQVLFTAATLLGDAGNDGGPSTASNGNLVIVSNRADFNLAVPGPGGVTQPGPTNAVMMLMPTTPDFVYSGLGHAVANRAGQVYGDQYGLGMIWFSANEFATGGFGSLALSVGQGALGVAGSVNLTASREIKVADGGVLQFSPAVSGTGPVGLSLAAPYVAVGGNFLGPLAAGSSTSPFSSSVAPSGGSGWFDVTAGTLIDVGNLVVQGVGSVNLDATNGGTTMGAIRGDGSLEAAGTISLRAGQIYPPTDVVFNVLAFDVTSVTNGVSTVVTPGAIAVAAGTGAAPAIPLSAGGQLNLYATSITQAGVLQVPLGQIQLGGSASSGTDPVSGLNLPVTSTLVLAAGSTTSVSAISAAGTAATIPYGINLNGTAWIDPAGNDITSQGPPAKAITLVGGTIQQNASAVVDLAGGGDLYSYQWVPGTGGTVDVLAATSGSFAILPATATSAAYADLFAPVGAYNSSTNARQNLGTDLGYTVANATLSYQVGDRIYLAGNAQLPAGSYTLLPARYALLPGAFLVTPVKSATTTGVVAPITLPDGSAQVSGYRFDGLDGRGYNPGLFTTFAIASATVVQQRAQYVGYSADTFFGAVNQTTLAQNQTQSPTRSQTQTLGPTPLLRLPVDAGQLVLVAQTGLSLNGQVDALAATGGQAGLVDISSPSSILIASPADIAAMAAGASGATQPGSVILNSTQLSSFGSESLLIGGVRTIGTAGTTVAVAAPSLTVDNAGAPLTGTDVVLVSNGALTLAPGAQITTGNLPAITSTPLQLNDTSTLAAVGATLTVTRGGTPISLPNGTPGGGLLTSTAAGVITYASGTTVPILATTGSVTNAFAVPAGATITLNQAGTLAFASTTDKTPQAITLALGDGAAVRVSSDPAAQILRSGVAGANVPSLTIGAGAGITGAGVVLDSTYAQSIDSSLGLNGVSDLTIGSGRLSLQFANPGALTTTDSLLLTPTLLSTLQGTQQVLTLRSYSTIDLYGTGSLGTPTLSLNFDTGAIRGFNQGAGTIALQAQNLGFSNLAGVAAPIAPLLGTGLLQFNAAKAALGKNALDVQGFAAVALDATGPVLASSTGSFDVQGGSLAMQTTLLSAASNANYQITADGALTLVAPAGTSAPAAPASLGGKLSLQGASVAVATQVAVPAGTLSLTALTGDLKLTGATLAAGGVTQTFYDTTKYANAGTIDLAADAGNVLVDATSLINVAAAPGGGSAGTVAISAPLGQFSVGAGALLGQAGLNGQGGSFTLDARGILGTDPSASHLALLSATLATGGFDQAVAIRVRQGDLVIDGPTRAHNFTASTDAGNLTVTGSIDASGFTNATAGSAFGTTFDPADPTGGLIALTAAGNLVLAPSAWLTVAGYAYNDAGKGGAITLTAGAYTASGTTVNFNQAGAVTVQPGARLELGVEHAFTTTDMAMNPTVPLPVDSRTDLTAGTLLVSEPRTAVGNGAQFAGLPGQADGASSIVVEGFQVYDLARTDGSVTTSGSLTSVGSGGIIGTAVEQAVKSDGTKFATAVAATAAANPLLQFQPGAEIVNSAKADGSTTAQLVTLYSSTSTSRSLVNFNLLAGSGTITTVTIPGGLPATVTLKTTTGRLFSVTTADGVTTAYTTASGATTIASASATNPIVAINFKNTGSSALSTQLNFNTGTTPFTLAFSPTAALTNSFAVTQAVQAGDLVLANTWDLATYRYGTAATPGILTLRSAGNLVFNFDASLSDGFDQTNPVDPRNPLWTALLLPAGSLSTTYHLVAGADYGAADATALQSLSGLAANRGSILLGAGAIALPTATSGSTVSRSVIIPKYYQTIRTGTGDITLAAGRDVQFLNPLMTVYTAGSAAPILTGFDLPNLTALSSIASTPYYSAQYSQLGGNVSIDAQNDVARYLQTASGLVASSSLELPTNWLYRRGNVDQNGFFTALAGSAAPTAEIQSTSWWIDFSNFFGDVGALGGGNVTIAAGHNVSNVGAAVPTDARTPGRNAAGQPILASTATLQEMGGGDLSVTAGNNINAGVYYAERGTIALDAGGSVTTNATRAAFNSGTLTNPVTWLPTALFLGQGSVDVTAAGNVTLGAVANPFWLPQGAGNRAYEKTYFTTFDPNDSVTISSLAGSVTLQGAPDTATASSVGSAAWLQAWYADVLSSDRTAAAAAQPWLRLAETGISPIAPILPFAQVAVVQPATLDVTTFTGNINVNGSLTLAPSPVGNLSLLAAGQINGLGVNGVAGTIPIYGEGVVNLSDADPNRLPGVLTPLSFATYTSSTPYTLLSSVTALFAETGSTSLSLAQKLALHGQTVNPGTGQSGPLHAADPRPVRLYAAGGDLSGLTVYSAKPALVMAYRDITDVALYLQNVTATSLSVVAAGRDIVAYDPTSLLRTAAAAAGGLLPGAAGDTGAGTGNPNAGDLEVAGPGSLEVMAGRNLNLGSGNAPTANGTAAGLLSVGSIANPYLPQNSGASLVVSAGVGTIYTAAAAARGQTPGLAAAGLDYTDFVEQFLDPATAGSNSTPYLGELGQLMGLANATPDAVWAAFGYQKGKAVTNRQAALLVNLFEVVLRDAGRMRNDAASPAYGTYTSGLAAIAALFPGSPLPSQATIISGGSGVVQRPASPWTGNVSLATREILTVEGGDITVLAPGGGITVGRATDPQKPDQGILTERGGNISLFATDSINVGTSRIFTLLGGNEIVWSTWGDIAAGSGSKTVYSAPPTRVLIDPQSANVQNDLAGLATGAGIGVLATLTGVQPGNVDLIAPVGTVDAGDAGIRATGNLNVAARVVLNSTNIQVGGVSAGTPPPPAPPNLAPLAVASTTGASANNAAADVARQNAASNQAPTILPSIITVDVLGYGGGDDDDNSDSKDKSKRKPSDQSGAGSAAASAAPVRARPGGAGAEPYPII